MSILVRCTAVPLLRLSQYYSQPNTTGEEENISLGRTLLNERSVCNPEKFVPRQTIRTLRFVCAYLLPVTARTGTTGAKAQPGSSKALAEGFQGLAFGG
jgi:hypothetical protein